MVVLILGYALQSSALSISHNIAFKKCIEHIAKKMVVHTVVCNLNSKNCISSIYQNYFYCKLSNERKWLKLERYFQFVEE